MVQGNEQSRLYDVIGGGGATNLTFVFNICINAVSIVPSGSETDVRRANTDVRWVGFLPLECCNLFPLVKFSISKSIYIFPIL